MAAPLLCSDTIWLHPASYNIVPLRSGLAPRIAELKEALKEGLPGVRDKNRKNFYDIELPGGWYYIHVCDSARTVYLVAHAPAQ